MCRRALLCGALLAAVAAIAAAGAKVNITVSKETTYVTGPLHDDGTVNYVAYLNAKYSEGVTKDNNAAVVLLGAFGPEWIQKDVRKATCAKLGVPVPDPAGRYFMPFEEHLESKGSGIPPEKARRVLRQVCSGPWRPRRHRTVAAWLKANAKPLDRIVAATKRERFYFPLVCKEGPWRLVRAAVSGVGPYREAARALMARAMLALGRGQLAEAQQDLLAVQRLGTRVARGPTLIHHLLGMSIDSLAWRGTQALATRGRLPGEEVSQMLARLKDAPALPGLRDAFLGERLVLLESIAMCATDFRNFRLLLGRGEGRPGRGGAPQRLDLDWDSILRRANRWHDKLAAPLDERSFAAKQRAIRAYRKDVRALKQRAATGLGAGNVPNPLQQGGRKRMSRAMGDLILATLLPSLGRVHVLDTKARAQRDLAEVALALAAWKADKGRHPSKLSVLSPEYFESVPKDRFTDEPLIYKRRGDGYILYSAGEDTKDDGGQHEDGDDLVVRAAK